MGSPTIPGLKVKAIINRFTGQRIPASELNEDQLEYAEKNRDHFNFIYTGDVIEGEPTGDRIENTGPVDLESKAAPDGPKFNVEQLLKLNKAHLIELAESMALTIEGDATKESIAALIVAEQNKGG